MNRQENNSYDFLPSWSDCVKAVDNNTAGAIERFIYDNEPADDYKLFRLQLCACLNEWVGNKLKG